MSPVEHYATNVRAFVETWLGRSLAHVPYQTVRNMRQQGRPWSTDYRFTYPAQRLARLGYLDEAHGLPDRLRTENWPSAWAPGVKRYP
ncbi:hypothetical protein [Pseudomonas mosselii]|uniref:hypothetical protein n=1 Tax=Pseudomonas mosselii TaxID=78327 RepID=UPI0021DAE4C6|nr:hypothetical protein [Pseudomonas mosselii]MCU9527468.1 hypothetical protein [Pseudomonas mosselii]MCU9534781.1 hypothetical protein [Pseudomonas mosselii]MCU9542715.1 hypothetical protein [Pseudomonas mosselii]MCU9546621.1 hypothetical protein [Pseudomonas mosselii]